MRSDTGRELNNSLLYSFPINATVRFSIGDRVEVGGWFFGGYGKFLILKPEPAATGYLDRIALSAFVSGHMAGHLLGGQTESSLLAGLLTSYPLNEKCNLTSGIYGMFSRSQRSQAEMDFEFWVVKLTADRLRLVLPLSINYKVKYRAGQYIVFGGINFPLDLMERYSITIDRGIDEPEIRSLGSSKRLNAELRAGVNFPVW